MFGLDNIFKPKDAGKSPEASSKLKQGGKMAGVLAAAALSTGAVEAGNAQKTAETGDILEMNVQMPKTLRQAAPTRELRHGEVNIGGQIFADTGSSGYKMTEAGPDSASMNPELKKGKELKSPNYDVEVQQFAQGFMAQGISEADSYEMARKAMEKPNDEFNIKNLRQEIDNMKDKKVVMDE